MARDRHARPRARTAVPALSRACDSSGAPLLCVGQRLLLRGEDRRAQKCGNRKWKRPAVRSRGGSKWEKTEKLQILKKYFISLWGPMVCMLRKKRMALFTVTHIYIDTRLLTLVLVLSSPLLAQLHGL